MKMLKLCISRYSVLPALWVFLAATTYAQSSTRCTTTPDGAGASYTNCTTTTQPTDGSSQTQTQTNCTKTYDGSGGSFKNCTSNTTTTAPPAGGRLTGIAEVAAASSAAHPRPVSPTSPGSQSVPLSRQQPLRQRVAGSRALPKSRLLPALLTPVQCLQHLPLHNRYLLSLKPLAPKPLKHTSIKV